MKKMKILLLLLSLVSCSNQPNSSYGYDQVSEAKVAVKEEMLEDEERSNWVVEYPDGNLLAQNNRQLTYQPPQGALPPINKKPKPKIIKTANIQLEIKEYETDDQRIRDLVKMMDGYISSEAQENQYYQKSNTIIVRLVPEKLDNFLHQLKKIGKKVINASVSSKDVTKEFVDMKIRIQSKTEVIERYRDLLKKAKTVEEILKVENELRIVVEELESVKGRLNYLKNQVGLSTVTIHYFQNIDQPDREQPGFFSKIGDAFGDGFQGLKGFIIGMVSIWPFLLILTIIIYFARNFLKRRRKSKA